ncbi:Ferritin Dps family protein [Caldithrix abyssi DSM 13497]|uniref:Ferritin Dps family protein n=1 Tax=Caldithrix abyssi DSM 13497 TaxID=880073 RepID=H1XRT9_CALAY|nr:DNA starvation/stationary phase protection protein [Caldithrix abyssi]APF17160.1 starvation-inducible DNA-binding protein [Caldithrix abyssi DSM 13497]EHO41299.1 Ferritin Dps family protein [Caldithrix abyssi DSM 13497]
MNQELLIANLQRTLSNLQVLYVKLHNYHWNVKGKQFFGLHELTEGYYNYMTEQYDAIAERILQLGKKPLVTMKDYLEKATLDESAKTDFTAEEVIDGLLADFDVLLKDFKEISSAAAELNDTTTANLADGNVEWLEKAIWMLKASK